MQQISESLVTNKMAVGRLTDTKALPKKQNFLYLSYTFFSLTKIVGDIKSLS